jgi:hypothetical protein
MVKLTVNLDGVGEAREVIDAGRYEAKVTEVEQGDSQSGNPMLTWSWEITSGNYVGHEIRSYTSLQEHALFGLKAHLVAFGFEPEGDLDFDTDKFVGKKAILVITKEQIQNRDGSGMVDVNRVKSVYKMEKSASSGPAIGAKKPVVGGKVAGKGKVPF